MTVDTHDSHFISFFNFIFFFAAEEFQFLERISCERLFLQFFFNFHFCQIFRKKENTFFFFRERIYESQAIIPTVPIKSSEPKYQRNVKNIPDKHFNKTQLKLYLQFQLLGTFIIVILIDFFPNPVLEKIIQIWATSFR